MRVGSISLQTITQTLRRLPSTTFLVLVSYLYFFAFNWAGIVKGGNLNFNMNGPPVSDFVLFSCCRFFFLFSFSRHFLSYFCLFFVFFYFVCKGLSSVAEFATEASEPGSIHVLH